MEKTLPELVEILKSRGLEYAVYNWTAQDGCSDWFDPSVGKATISTNEEKRIELSAQEIAGDYQDVIENLLLEHYPDFDFDIGTYGEVYVYASGKVEIVLTKRVYGEEYHRKDVDLLSTHSSV